MNGQEAAEAYLNKFEEWAADKSDADFRSLARGGKLSRQEIFKGCGFGRSVLTQNPRVRAALAELEVKLRKRGVLSELAEQLAGEDGVDEPEPLRQMGQAENAAVQARLNDLEQRVQLLLAENADLRNRLARFGHIENVLASTGRLPR